MFKSKVKYVAHVLSVLFQECITLDGQLTSLTLSCMENFKNIAKKNFFLCLTSKRHKIHKNGARKFWLEANCRKFFFFFHFFIGKYVLIFNQFSAMTSQRWVGDFVHLSGQHARKG